MLIVFIHNNKAFLPEVAAYIDYFSERGIRCEAVKPNEIRKLKPDVAWHFMGTDSQKNDGFLKVHEYTSASVPPFPKIKNSIKKILNPRPDYRIFLNEYVQTAFAFDDGVPFGYRDMGVPEKWLALSAITPKPGTFIYTGEIKNRSIEQLLEVFARGAMKDYFLSIISKDYEELSKAYASFNNMSFTGPMEHEKVQQYIMEAQFAINYMPDREPFNQQTSTKLLEYAACGKQIITSDYAWMRRFQETYGGKYFYLAKDLSNLVPAAVNECSYQSADISAWTWEKQIERSGITAFLEKKFPGLSLRSS